MFRLSETTQTRVTRVVGAREAMCDSLSGNKQLSYYTIAFALSAFSFQLFQHQRVAQRQPSVSTRAAISAPKPHHTPSSPPTAPDATTHAAAAGTIAAAM